MSTGASDINQFTGINRAQVITLLAAPPPIGSTTPNTGAFTGLTLSGAPGKIVPAVDSTTALQIANAAGTAFVNLDTSDARVAIAKAAQVPVTQLHIIDVASSADAGLIVEQDVSAAASAVMQLRKARGSSFTSPATVNNGDFIGVLSARVHDGTSFLATANIGFKVNGTVATGSIPTDILFSTGATNDPGLGNLRMTLSGTSLKVTLPLVLSGAPGKIQPAADSSTALQVANTAGTAFVDFDTTNLRMAIAKTSQAPAFQLHMIDTSAVADSGLAIEQNSGSASAAVMNFRKTRGASFTSPTTVANGDFIGVISGRPYDGAAYLITTNIAFKVNGTVASGSIPTDIIFATGATTDGGLNNEKMRISSVGVVTQKSADAGTNTVLNMLSVMHDSTGSIAANYGTGLIIGGQDSTSPDITMTRLRTFWTVATHASRTARSVWSVFDTNERDAIAIEASGTVAMVGFYGTAPIVKPATTGTTTGFTAGGGTTVTDASTFTGGTGATAYRISDIVLALKTLGLMTT